MCGRANPLNDTQPGLIRLASIATPSAAAGARNVDVNRLGSSDVGTLTAFINGPTLAVRAVTGFG